jgi:hypothetical protein
MVTTDRGAQFTSALWTPACRSLGINHVLTTAYHPQSNGMVERVHRQLRPGVALPSASGADGPASSAERGFGCIINRAGYWDTIHTSWLATSHTQSSTCRRATTTHEASILCLSYRHIASSPSQGGTRSCACWRLGKPLAAPYASPCLVVSKGAKTFTVQVDQRQVISVGRLKAHTGLSPVSPAEAISRSCPPKKPAIQTEPS